MVGAIYGGLIKLAVGSWLQVRSKLQNKTQRGFHGRVRATRQGGDPQTTIKLLGFNFVGEGGRLSISCLRDGYCRSPP